MATRGRIGRRRGRVSRPPITARPQAATVAAPWRALCPASARLLRNPSAEQVRRAGRGERLILVSDRLLGRARLRRAARRGGLVVEREMLVLPGTRRALVTVDEDSAAIRMLWENVAAVPPGLTWAALPASAAVRLARRVPWQWTGAVIGGHVLIGRRQ